MKRLTCSLILVVLTLLAAGLPLAAQEEEAPPESPLLRLLRFVPNAPMYRDLLTFGDAAAWHASWDVPRIDGVDELDALDRDLRAYWMFIMPRQTVPPDPLGVQYLLSEDYRGVYGFDLFNLDRYLLAGQPPEWITVAEFSFDAAQIADALIATGYTSEALEPEGTLFSLMEDYQVDVSADLPMPGKLGNLNRVALLRDGQFVLGKATDPIMYALAAAEGDMPSLADDPAYVAAATAVEDPALGDLGALVGAILIDGVILAPMVEDVATAPAGALPIYRAVNFATRHGEGASYLVLAVVFPEGEDAGAAADVLAGRLRDYVSAVTGQPFGDRWAFERAASVEAAGLPVALVVMRVDDPPPTPDDAEPVPVNVFSWINLVMQRDLGFLALTFE